MKKLLVRNCFRAVDHPIHVSDSLDTILCPGGREGDRRIREASDIQALASEVRNGQ